MQCVVIKIFVVFAYEENGRMCENVTMALSANRAPAGRDRRGKFALSGRCSEGGQLDFRRSTEHHTASEDSCLAPVIVCDLVLGGINIYSCLPGSFPA